MPYATYDDVVKRYNPLTTMIGTTAPDVTSTDIASIYVNDAESFVNAYLRSKYEVPLQAEPLITMLTSDIAIYKVLEDRASRVPEIALNRYNSAIKTLEMLRDGQMTLSSSQTAVSTGDQEAFATNQDYHPIFSPVLKDIDQKADSDQIAADRAERENDF